MARCVLCRRRPPRVLWRGRYLGWWYDSFYWKFFLEKCHYNYYYNIRKIDIDSKLLVWFEWFFDLTLIILQMDVPMVRNYFCDFLNENIWVLYLALDELKWILFYSVAYYFSLKMIWNDFTSHFPFSYLVIRKLREIFFFFHIDGSCHEIKLRLIMGLYGVKYFVWCPIFTAMNCGMYVAGGRGFFVDGRPDFYYVGVSFLFRPNLSEWFHNLSEYNCFYLIFLPFPINKITGSTNYFRLSTYTTKFCSFCFYRWNE